MENFGGQWNSNVLTKAGVKANGKQITARNEIKMEKSWHEKGFVELFVGGSVQGKQKLAVNEKHSESHMIYTERLLISSFEIRAKSFLVNIYSWKIWQ